jgi:hypothetical protein
MKKTLSILLLLISVNLIAQSEKYSNEFLNIGVDARALALGNSVIAKTADVNSGYWNPAGLANVQNKQVSLMHAAYFANIAQYDYMAYAKKLNEQTGVSISLIRFGVDNIMNTTRLIDEQGNINYDRISYFSTADYALNLSLGRKNLWKGFDVGATAKLIYRHIGEFASGFGFGFDIGAQYQYKKWQFGLMARDITTTFNYWSVDSEAFQSIANAIPGKNQTAPNSIELTLPKLQLGVNRNFKLKENLDLSAEMDLNMRFFKMHTLVSSDFVSIDPAVGLEFSYYKTAFLRLGVNNFQKEQYFDQEEISFQPNAGLGFTYKGIQVDYALTNIGSDNFFSHVFSLNIDIDKLFPAKK